MTAPQTVERSAPRLTASILTRNSAARIADRIAEAHSFADEVIVGVDASSVDHTFEVASELADVTYRFRHPGQLAPARLLPLEYASGHWILSLDDDESMEQSFDEIREELLQEDAVTHYYFPRKWIVNLSPCEYLRAMPWYPDWQLRLFRKDASLVWKPPRAHSGYRVQGTGFFEERASILHFERLWCDAEARRKKLDNYRQTSGGVSEDFYDANIESTRGLCQTRSVAQPVDGTRKRRVENDVRDLKLAAFPDWRACLVADEIPQVASVGASIIAEIRAQNIGRFSWSAPTGKWPALNLSFHLLDPSGRVLREGPRFAMPRLVRPGEGVRLLATFQAPLEPGDYLLGWDLVSEGECWFAHCGSEVLRTPLRVLE